MMNMSKSMIQEMKLHNRLDLKLFFDLFHVLEIFKIKMKYYVKARYATYVFMLKIMIIR